LSFIRQTMTENTREQCTRRKMKLFGDLAYWREEFFKRRERARLERAHHE
jgi:hypothetical protein